MPRTYINIMVVTSSSEHREKLWMNFDIIGGFPPLPSQDEFIERTYGMDMPFLPLFHELSFEISPIFHNRGKTWKFSLPLMALGCLENSLSQNIGVFLKDISPGNSREAMGNFLTICDYTFYLSLHACPIFFPEEWSLLSSVFFWSCDYIWRNILNGLIPCDFIKDTFPHEIESILDKYHREKITLWYPLVQFSHDEFHSFRVKPYNTYPNEFYSSKEFFRIHFPLKMYRK